MTTDTEEIVGYGKPPKSTQFKKGISGNPNGRPKGARSLVKLLDDLVNEKVKITQEDGRIVRIAKKQVMLLQAVNKACKGDLKALATLLPKLDIVDAKAEEREDKVQKMAETDDEIVKEYIEKHFNLHKTNVIDEDDDFGGVGEVSYE